MKRPYSIDPPKAYRQRNSAGNNTTGNTTATSFSSISDDSETINSASTRSSADHPRQRHSVSSRSTKALMTETERSIAQELNQLSLQERNSTFEEIHGVAKAIQETPEFVSRALLQFQSYLDSGTNNKAYDRAMFLSPKYVKSLRLAFLRAEDFDFEKAALRMITYFQSKLHLFGERCLVKNIQLADLQPDDLLHLQDGSIQANARTMRDQSGRLVYFTNAKHYTYKTVGNSTRASWYLLESNILGHDDVQRKGMVVVLYVVGWDCVPPEMLQSNDKSSVLTKSMPIRHSAIHVCTTSEECAQEIISQKLLKMSKQARLRFRVHCSETVEELFHRLQSYGIVRNILPVEDFDGSTPRRDQMIQYLLQMKQYEQQQHQQQQQHVNTNDIDYPNEFDVLCGRGKPYQHFSGNAKMSVLIDRDMNLFFSTKYGGKRPVCDQIVRQVHGYGGRFLKRNNEGGWMIVSDADAAGKVSHTFRSKLKSLKGSVKDIKNR